MTDLAGGPRLVFEIPITTRWSDFDAGKHLNNATYLTYLEHAREAFFEAVGIARDGNVLARTELDFEIPVGLDTRELRCQITCSRIGNTSVHTREVLLGQEGVALRALSVSVLVGPNGRPTPLPTHIRSELERYSSPTGRDTSPEEPATFSGPTTILAPVTATPNSQ